MSAAQTTMPLVERLQAALAEIGAGHLWEHCAASADDPDMGWTGEDEPSESDWAKLWQAFGVARPEYAVPCFECWISGEVDVRELVHEVCLTGWPDRDCGRAAQ